MQSNQAQNIVTENDWHNEQRTSAETRRQESHLLIEPGRRRIVKSDRFSNVDVFRKLFDVEWDGRPQACWHIV